MGAFAIRPVMKALAWVVRIIVVLNVNLVARSRLVEEGAAGGGAVRRDSVFVR